MEALRKFTNVLVLLFLLFAVLVLLNVISTEYLDATFTSFNPENYYKTIFGIAAAFLLVYLLISNMSILSLKKERNLLNHRINELKANLYDKKEEIVRQQTRENRPAEPQMPKVDPIFPPDNLQ
jgi:hypothetical protein